MTQLELGTVLNYSDKAVSKWERGEAIPDAYVLLQLSEIFGVSVDYLLKEHIKPPPAVTKINHTSVVLLTVIAVFTLFFGSVSHNASRGIYISSDILLCGYSHLYHSDCVQLCLGKTEI